MSIVDPNEEFIAEFLAEAGENVDVIDRDLLQLEANPTPELIARIFRATHTIKGACGFMGLTKLESVSHAAENLLARLRDGALPMSRPIADILLRSSDAIRQILGCLGRDGSEGEVDYSPLIGALAAACNGMLPEVPPPAPQSQPEAKAEARNQPEVTTPAPQPVTPAPLPAMAAAPVEEPTGPSVADSFVRVDVNLLDRLMDLVGELVLARNQLLPFVANQTNTAFAGAAQRLNLITTELQADVMKTRMQPIGNVWNKLNRLVRDVAATCGKQVQLELEGSETELDRTILEAVKDPLTHVVRNAIDHGLETPAVRLASGKPAAGRLNVRAYHEGGHVILEVVDDGAGIDPSRVRARAIQRGLLTADQADRMPEREIVNLVFTPGFSTAEKVTNVSGRGVGMDVVRSNVERVGGVVDLVSWLGQGTMLRMKIPLTLAIIPALVIWCAGQRYALPQASLLELVRIGRKSHDVEYILGRPFYRLRGALLPLAPLREILALADSDSEELNIVVLQAEDRKFGLVVDDIADTQEIVVKPLGRQLDHLPVYAGATILGDGAVSLILEVMGLARLAGVIDESSRRALADRDRTEAAPRQAQTAILVFVAGSRRFAMPLSAVARLEELPLSKVERGGQRAVVQYRGRILPLVRVPGTPSDAPLADPLQVIVYSNGTQTIGIVVDRIIDVIEEELDVAPASDPGSSGLAVIGGLVTEMLDLEALLPRAPGGGW